MHNVDHNNSQEVIRITVIINTINSTAFARILRYIRNEINSHINTNSAKTEIFQRTNVYFFNVGFFFQRKRVE